MTRQVRLALAAFCPVILLLPGCLSYFNPVNEPPLECRRSCEEVPAPCKQKVYVVLMNGADLFCCGNMSGVRDYLNKLGFVKTYYAQIYHESCLLKELRLIHDDQPDARIAIVGFEYAAAPAQSLADNAAKEGIPVDVVILLQPKALWPAALSAEQRLITIEAGKPDPTDPAATTRQTIKVPCDNRYGVPTHSVTLEVLAQELTSLAMGVPIPEVLSEPFPSVLDDPAPTPRPMDTRNATPPHPVDAKPVSRPKPDPINQKPTPKLQLPYD